MARPEVASVLAKDFIALKIDEDRMVGGKDVLAAARKAAGLQEGGGIPWIVFYDAEGNALANSEGPKGNIGFPYQPEEVAHFVSMLQKACSKMTVGDIEALRKSLDANREADEAKKKAAQAGSKQYGARLFPQLFDLRPERSP